jgi:hypothetical protein
MLKCITIWWSEMKLIHCSFLKPEETITAEFHCNKLSVCQGKLQRQQLALVKGNGPILPHDNARAAIARTTC